MQEAVEADLMQKHNISPSKATDRDHMTDSSKNPEVASTDITENMELVKYVNCAETCCACI